MIGKDRFLLILNSSFSWPIAAVPMTMTKYFSDPVNSFRFYPIAFQMKGDPIEFLQNDLVKLPQTLSYTTKIFRSSHVPGDPLLDCTEYSPNNTFDNCLKSEIAEMFEKVLNCVLPWYTGNTTRVCDNLFNMTET